ncbi:MAG: hypothetical protein ACJAT6_000440 [Akkermansiaceae bacterium]|jgi:hypothetical protein
MGLLEADPRHLKSALEEMRKLAQGAAEDGTMDELLGEFLGGLEGAQLVPAPEASSGDQGSTSSSREAFC